MPSLGPWEVFAILAVLLLLFGAKKLPDLSRSMGRSLRIFKSEVKDLRNDDDREPPAAAPAPPPREVEGRVVDSTSHPNPTAEPTRVPEAERDR